MAGLAAVGFVQHHFAVAVDGKVNRAAGGQTHGIADRFGNGDLAFDGEGGAHVNSCNSYFILIG